jgi:large conductance mechanosensitive channel
MAFKGFREFLLRGNVIDLAVAVTIGTAFTAVVMAVTSSLLHPLVNVFLGGGVSGGKLRWLGQVFDFGAVINALISFAIIAAVVYFVVVIPMRKLVHEPKKEPPDEAALLLQIRDLLAQRR